MKTGRAMGDSRTMVERWLAQTYQGKFLVYAVLNMRTLPKEKKDLPFKLKSAFTRVVPLCRPTGKLSFISRVITKHEIYRTPEKTTTEWYDHSWTIQEEND